MHKNYEQEAQESFSFFPAALADGETKRKGDRAKTRPLSGAKLIDLERIKPDPNQPRKRFVRKTLESLADSMREVGGIIDPLTVEYDEKEDCFKIISGERRYRAAKILGLERLPCIVRDVDGEKRLLLQLIVNLQREDITALEESSGIRSLIEKFGYSQVKAAKLLNKSKSYISQILGLERLAQPAREIVQTSELPKEVQIRASRETDSERQIEILRKASEEGKTVRQIRAEGKADGRRDHDRICQSVLAGEKPEGTILDDGKSWKWEWTPGDGKFVVTIRFQKKYGESKRIEVIKAALEEARNHLEDR